MSDNAVLKLEQEDFYVGEAERIGKRLTVIRPDRISTEADPCYLKVNDKKYRILNISSFGLAVEVVGEAIIFSEKEPAKILFREIEVDEVYVRVLRAQKQNEITILYGLEVIGEPLSTDKVKALKEAHKIILEQEVAKEKFSNVPNEFKQIVLESKSWLESLEEKVESAQATSQSLQMNFDREVYKQTIAAVISDYLQKNFVPIYNHLASVLEGKDKKTVKASFRYFRKQLEKLIYQAPYANRTYYKPRGYAGDYEMMNQTYSTKAIGDSLFAMCLHKYFIEEPAAKAVRNRGYFLQEKIYQFLKETSKEEVSILSVACGPAEEIFQMLRKYKNDIPKVNFYLLDQDVEALKFTQSRLRSLKNELELKHEFHVTNLAIKNVIENGLPSEQFDYVYTAGLFDYFSKSVAQIAALKLFEGLKENGQLTIGNFSINNPNKFGMEMTLDWKLIYRTHQDMEDMFKLTTKNPVVEEEELGINLFATVKK